MSYDLTLFHPAAGSDPLAAYHEFAEQQEAEILEPGGRERQIPESVRAEMQQIADVLKDLWPPFTQLRLRQPGPWIELDDPHVEVQVTISERSIGISMPYFRAGAAEKIALMKACVEALQREGFAAYDPQLDRILETKDFDDMLAQYRAMDETLPEIVARAKEAAEKKSREAAAKPWWKFW